MLQSYDDILNHISYRIRREHYFYYLHQDEGHEGAHPECKSFSYDVLGKPDAISKDGERCCSCVAKPGWYDENGTPRFARHHPSLCPDIHATEVALLLIGCQSCGNEYRVQMSWSLAGEIMRRAAYEATGSIPRERSRSTVGSDGLAVRIKDGTIHFGDPPCFHSGCTSGATMNCWDLRVLEFWSRNRPVTGSSDWQRVPELEVDLPDATDPERTTGVPHHPCPQCKKLVADHDGFGVLAHVAPMPDACGYCTHPSISDGVCGICQLAMVSDHEYTTVYPRDRQCRQCGRSRKEHMR